MNAPWSRKTPLLAWKKHEIKARSGSESCERCNGPYVGVSIKSSEPWKNWLLPGSLWKQTPAGFSGPFIQSSWTSVPGHRKCCSYLDGGPSPPVAGKNEGLVHLLIAKSHNPSRPGAGIQAATIRCLATRTTRPEQIHCLPIDYRRRPEN